MRDRKTRFTAILTLALVPALLTACDDDDDITDPNLVTTADLAGTFDAESAVFTDVDDPNTAVPLVTSGGELVMDVTPQGAFTTTIRQPGLADVTRTGTVAVDGDELVISESGFAARRADFTFDEPTGTFTIEDEGDRFDFDGAGVERGAVSQIELKRRANN